MNTINYIILYYMQRIHNYTYHLSLMINSSKLYIARLLNSLQRVDAQQLPTAQPRQTRCPYYRLREHFKLCIGPLAVNAKQDSKNLGVTFDQHMNFESHVKKVVQSCFFQLRNIAKIKSILSTPDLEKVVRAFLSSRLDYCNSLFTTLSSYTI